MSAHFLFTAEERQGAAGPFMLVDVRAGRVPLGSLEMSRADWEAFRIAVGPIDQPGPHTRHGVGVRVARPDAFDSALSAEDAERRALIETRAL
ncbi:MAG: hypothetical protein ACRDXE_10520 [Acidimicrobiales bacterium]